MKMYFYTHTTKIQALENLNLKFLNVKRKDCLLKKKGVGGK